jgi:O-antigen chain-terminating methyltransferase
MDQRQSADAAYVKSQLSVYAQLIHSAVNSLPKSRNGDSKIEAVTRDIDSKALDPFYLAFEDAFRGPRDEIKRRLEVYLPHVKAAKAGSKTKPVLDLGCGRGEWLELLRDRKLVARGVDLNASMVEVCTAGKLKVTHADAIEFLKAQRAKTFGAVTSFHLIEHLPFETLVELVRECWRVLRPGGLLIYETPNPENIRVGAHYFYRDYTHQRPLPPDSTQFLVQHIGFKKVDLLRLNPCAPQERVKDDGLEVAERFNDYFYSAQDYAVVAVK